MQSNRRRALLFTGLIVSVLFIPFVSFAAGTVCQIANGCTGTSTAPSYGQLLLGNSLGGYSLAATSSLGISGGGSSASSTLLTDNNTFSGADSFTSASSNFGGTWQTYSPSHFLTGNQTITLSGDVSGSGATSITTAFNLANSHWWTALQNFGNATTSGLEATSTNVFFDGPAAGSLLATNANKQLVATTTIANTLLQTSGVSAGSYTNTSLTVNAEGIITAASSGSGSGVSSVSGTWPILSSGGITPAISWGGLATSTNLTAPDLIYATGAKTIGQVATSSAACSGFITCSGFTVVGSVSPTITTTGTLGLSSGGTAASLSGASGIAAMNSGNTALSIPSTSYTLTSSLLTAPNASTTNITDYDYAAFGATATDTIPSNGNIGVSSSTPTVAVSLGANKTITTTEASTTFASTVYDDWFANQQTKIEMTGNITLHEQDDTLPGMTHRLILCQDGTGSRTVSWGTASDTIVWAGGTIPTQTSTAGACDVYSFITTGATGSVEAFAAATQNFP